MANLTSTNSTIYINSAIGDSAPFLRFDNPFVYYCKAPIFKKEDIKDVIIKDPAVIVFFTNGDKQSVVAHDGDVFNPEAGIALCILKHISGGSSKANNILKYWMKQEQKETLEKLKKQKASCEKKEIEARRKAKKIAKKKAYLERKRNEHIEIQAQAIIRANELMNSKGSFLL